MHGSNRITIILVLQIQNGFLNSSRKADVKHIEMNEQNTNVGMIESFISHYTSQFVAQKSYANNQPILCECNRVGQGLFPKRKRHNLTAFMISFSKRPLETSYFEVALIK